MSKQDLPLTDSVALNRLIEEVRSMTEPQRTTAYNRVHSRHNRS